MEKQPGYKIDLEIDLSDFLDKEIINIPSLFNALSSGKIIAGLDEFLRQMDGKEEWEKSLYKQ